MDSTEGTARFDIILLSDECSLQDNCLLNLEHLGTQPDLCILRAERNLIDDFYGAERCPKLKEVCPSDCIVLHSKHKAENLTRDWDRYILMAIPSRKKLSSTSWRV